MLTRRRVIGVLGSAPLACGQSLRPAKGAIIRTVLKDLAPEELADGATLFHEHMSLAPDSCRGGYNTRGLQARQCPLSQGEYLLLRPSRDISWRIST